MFGRDIRTLALFLSPLYWVLFEYTKEGGLVVVLLLYYSEMVGLSIFCEEC